MSWNITDNGLFVEMDHDKDFGDYVSVGTIGPERRETYRNIIAAAPDLLAALEESVIDFCDATCPTVWKTAEHEGRPHGPRCNANYAALAKARGES